MSGNDARQAPPSCTNFNCPKCGNELHLHPPTLTFKLTPEVTVYILSPSCSPEERKCRCGLVYVPILPPQATSGRIVYAAIADDEPPSRIIRPNLALPPDFDPRRGNHGN